MKGLFKNTLSIIAVAVLVVSMAQVDVFAADGDVTVDIFHTNDVHSRVSNYPLIGAYVDRARAGNANTLFFDAGDTLHGQTIATLEEGESIVKLLNEMGYDAMTPGNHDFNYGYEHLKNLSEKMDFPLLSCNIYRDDRPLFAPYNIFELDGVSVAVIGATTPDTVHSTHPDNIKGLDFKCPIETLNKSVAAIGDRADAIVVIAHVGIDKSSSVTSEQIAESVDGIDAIIDGHSHSLLPQGEVVNGVLIAQTGEYAENLGHVELKINKSAKENKAAASLVKLEDINTEDPLAQNYVEPKASVQKMIGDIEKEQEPIMSEVVGNSPYRLEGEKLVVRTQNTNLANLVSDITRAEAGTDIALHNGGNLRATIEAGDITRGDVITVLPFGNYVVTKTISGSAVLEMLEHGFKAYPEPVGGFPQYSGLTVAVDMAKPAGSRVTSVLVGSEPLDLNKEYTLATNDFLAAGGDEYAMLADPPITGEFSALDEIVIKHLREGFPIPETTDGRLVMLTEDAAQAAPEQTPVPAPIADVVAPELPLPAPAEVVPTAATDIYIVKAGDNLTRIGNMYGVSWRTIYNMNRDTIGNPNVIRIGQKLNVPAKAA